MEKTFVRGQIVAVRRHSWSQWELGMFLRIEGGAGEESRYVCLDAQGGRTRWRDCVPVQDLFPEANLGVPDREDADG